MVEWSHPIQKMHSLKFTNTLIFSRITNLKYSKLTNEDAKEKGVSDGERYRKKERKKECRVSCLASGKTPNIENESLNKSGRGAAV